MSMGRRRDRKREGWPDNLYPCKTGFKYRNPLTKKDTWMGVDFARAAKSAKGLNAMLVQTDTLIDKVIGGGKKVKDAINVFREQDMPERNWAEMTIQIYESILKRMETAIGGEQLATLGVQRCAEFIKDVTDSARSRQQFRMVLIWVLACAVQEGWIDTNPAISTRKAKSKRQRARLTIETYQKIHEHAPAWLQNAMDLSLVTLLRREDICMMKFADHHDGYLWIVPSKTEEITNVRLKIKADDQIEALIKRCRSDAVLSPFVIHRKPEKARPKHMRAKDREHHTQVLPEQLTRALAVARTKAKIPGDAPPSFHEIRSLGGAMLRDKGWTLPQVQALMGHASEEMTQLYMKGHEAPWLEVSTGIRLDSLGKASAPP